MKLPMLPEQVFSTQMFRMYIPDTHTVRRPPSRGRGREISHAIAFLRFFQPLPKRTRIIGPRFTGIISLFIIKCLFVNNTATKPETRMPISKKTRRKRRLIRKETDAVERAIEAHIEKHFQEERTKPFIEISSPQPNRYDWQYATRSSNGTGRRAMP